VSTNKEHDMNIDTVPDDYCAECDQHVKHGDWESDAAVLYEGRD
jgi:hypothetical protein